LWNVFGVDGELGAGKKGHGKWTSGGRLLSREEGGGRRGGEAEGLCFGGGWTQAGGEKGEKKGPKVVNTGTKKGGWRKEGTWGTLKVGIRGGGMSGGRAGERGGGTGPWKGTSHCLGGEEKGRRHRKVE